MISRSDFLAPAARRFADCRLSDGRPFRIRSLTEQERSQWEADSVDASGKPKKDRLLSARRRLICLTLVDDADNLVLSPADESLLASQDGKAMEEIYRAAAAHCGISDADVELLAKNSLAGPADVPA